MAASAVCDAMAGYIVEGKIGEGTFGEVFLIRHTRRRNAVFALKRSKPGRDGDFGGLTPSAVREATLLSALRHVNIVRLDKAHVNHEDGSLSLVRPRFWRQNAAHARGFETTRPPPAGCTPLRPGSCTHPATRCQP